MHARATVSAVYRALGDAGAALDHAGRAFEVTSAAGYGRFEPMACTALAAALVGHGRLAT